jgi:hypothetical protein
MTFVVHPYVGGWSLVIKYTVYPANLPEPTSSMVPYAPARVLITVPEEAPLAGVVVASGVAKPTASNSITDAAPVAIFALITFICALSSPRRLMPTFSQA